MTRPGPQPTAHGTTGPDAPPVTTHAEPGSDAATRPGTVGPVLGRTS